MNPNHINKISYMVPEIWFPNWPYFLVTYLCHLRKLNTFTSPELYCLITLICKIILISHIAQLLLIRKFYCFRPGPHISFKYEHNHLHCPMMGEVSLET